MNDNFMDNTLNVQVDVIIPTYKPGEKFKMLLDRLEAQTHKPDHIFVINTEEKYLDSNLITYDDVSVVNIKKEEFDHAGTRNLGVQHSDAPYFLMMTDDAVPYDKHLIEYMLSALTEDEDRASCYARQLAGPDSSKDEKYTRKFNYPDKSFDKSESDLSRLGIKTYFSSDVCCMYRRDIYDEIGGFEAPAIFNEDMVYASAIMKKGYKVRYCSEAMVIHSHDYTGIQQLHRNFDMGVSQCMHPEVFGGIHAEGEGMKMVAGNISMLLKHGDFIGVVRVVWRSACKLIGYKLGKKYKSLPSWLVLKLTTNRDFFIKNRSIL